MKKIIFFALSALVLGIGFVPATSFAADPAPSIFPTGFWGPIVTCRGVECTPDNDLASGWCKAFDTLKRALYVVLSIILFIVLPLTIMYGGMLIMTAGANAENVGAGRSAITGALVGIAIALTAFLIVNQFYAFILPSTPQSGTSLPGNVTSKQWYQLDCDLSKYKLLKQPGQTTP